jgi:hypothetical protein
MCLRRVKNFFHLKIKSQKRTRVATSQEMEKTVILPKIRKDSGVLFTNETFA